MKNHSLDLVLAILILALSEAAGKDVVKNYQPGAIPPKVPQTTTPPFENHWDSSSWERYGAEQFWHATTEANVPKKDLIPAAIIRILKPLKVRK